MNQVAARKGVVAAETKAADAYRAWLVDLDGTLYRPRPVKAAMAAELLFYGWSALPVIRAFRQVHEVLRECDTESGSSPYQLQLERTAERVQMPLAQVTEVVEAWMQHRAGKWLRMFRRRPLLDEIRRFRGAGGRTALVTDYPARRKLQAMGIGELFEVVVANGEPGGPLRLKPSPDGYLLAAEMLGLAPAECLVLGDRADADGLAAERAKMHFRLIA